ncbi:zinc finger, CCHC-type containing protein [Tanacetum coccineum]
MTAAKFDIKKFDGTGDFGLWRIKMRVLLIQHGCEAALEVLPMDMEAEAKAELNKKAHSIIILCLGNKVLREVTGETTAAEVWSKLKTLYMTKSLANKLYLKNKLYTFCVSAGRKITEHIDEFKKSVLDLANIEVKFKDEDLALILLTSLPVSYEHFVDSLLYGWEALTLEDVMATLNSKEIKEKDHLNRNCLKNNRKKSTGYVKKDKQLSSSGSTYDDSKLGDNRECKIRGIGKVRIQLRDGSSFVLHNVRYIPELKRNLISLETLEKEGFPVKLQSGKVKVINGSRVVLSGIRRDNCVYSLDGHAMAGELNASVEEKDSLAQVWHKRLGHISEAGLHVLEKQGLFGKKSLGKLDFCENCVLGKSHQVIFGVGRHTTQGVIDYVHSDLWGPSQVESLGGKRSPSTAIEKKTPMEMWSRHPRYPKGVKGYKLYRLDDESPKIVTSRNVVFNETVMYKDILKDSSACTDKSVEELQVEVNCKVEEEDTHEPLTYQEAVSCEESSKWKAAMKEEMDSLSKNKTWELVDHLAGQKLVSCKWLFKIMEGIEGVQNPRYKARLVARGFTQRAGIDYNEVFSLVVRHTSIRVILALTACKDYELEQLDVKMAFLYGNLEEVIYMRQPQGYEQGNKSLLKKEFGMKELGEAKKILGIEIVRDRSRKILRVSQSGYVSKILNNFRIDNGKLVKMPLGGHFKSSLKDCPVRDCDVERMSKVPYANAVGSLMYLMVCTRPDIAYAVSIVSRYLASPGKNHSEAVKWILKYLRDYAKDPDKGRSITNYAFLVQGCIVSWKATLQYVVALLTTEAEYMALTEAVKEAIWLRGLLEELGVELNTVAVNCDNQGAIH